MANRRMFSKTIIDADEFIEMPATARLLYYDLGMRADDDGFVQPQRVIKMTSAAPDDLKVLIAKKLIISFDEGKVLVVADWKIHNNIRTDRYTETIYKEYKKLLYLNENKQYCIDGGMTSGMTSGNHRLGKDRLGEDSVCRFAPPTPLEVQEYCQDRKNNVDPVKWHDFYTAKGWMVGKNKMKDWRAAVRTWERGEVKQMSEEDKLWKK